MVRLPTSRLWELVNEVDDDFADVIHEELYRRFAARIEEWYAPPS